MNATRVTEDTFKLTVNAENILFEGIWDVPNGVAMNSYIINGDKTAIVDGVCGWDGVPEKLFAFMESLGIDPGSLEYVIINHMEPDHSGWLESLIRIYPDFKVICSKEAADLLASFYRHTENIMTIHDGFELDLGKGHVLRFYEIPNVHWPDTMVTFDALTGTLFSCDAFGSYGKITSAGYDDQLTEEEIAFFEKEAVRYYSNIVAVFSSSVLKAIEKCSALPIRIVAPGHGIVWRKDPEKIINDYKRYASYQKGPAKEEITVIWGSMYGMTEKAVRHVERVLEQENIRYNIHRVPETSWGTILASVWDSTGIILAMPTYEYKMFPPMAAVLEELCKKKVSGRKAFRLGSFGWSGGAQKELDEIMNRNRAKWDFIEPVEFQGSPSDQDLELIAERVRQLVRAVRESVRTS